MKLGCEIQHVRCCQAQGDRESRESRESWRGVCILPAGLGEAEAVPGQDLGSRRARGFLLAPAAWKELELSCYRA